MLIEKKESIVAGNVAVIRLISGEEIVGKVVDITPLMITLTKPVVLQMQMISAKEAGLGFAPFMVGAEEAGKYTFQVSKLILDPMKARADIAGNYLKATTGLEIPTAGNTASGLVV